MVFEEATCKNCGIGFRYPSAFGQVAFCSAHCRVQHQPPQHPWEYKGCYATRYYRSRRRAKMRRGDKIDPLVVFNHYGWTCHLCGDQIDRTLLPPDRMCATIDHEIPLSLGGRHTWDNIKPAHAICNEEKEIR